MDEVPELPDWITVLIEDARDEGYSSGLEAGRNAAWDDMKRVVENRGDRWGYRL